MASRLVLVFRKREKICAWFSDGTCSCYYFLIFLRVHPTEPIILIGPIGAGKTTIGKMLSKKLSVPFFSLDEEERKYTRSAGYDVRHHTRLKKQKGFLFAYGYVREFFDKAVIGFLKAHKEGIFDFGGGHPVVPNRKKQQRIHKALKPYKNIVLLMPTKDIKESLKILRKRNKIKDDEDDFNLLYFNDRTFWSIAKFIVYTDRKTPKETCDEILKKIH